MRAAIIIWLGLGLGTSTSLAAPIDLSHNVPAINQGSSDLCWLAGASMLISSKEGKTVSMDEIAKRAGSEFEKLAKEKKPLHFDQMAGFIKAIKVTAEAPQNYTAKGWADLFRAHGPLWVGGWDKGARMAHVRVIKAMKGDDSHTSKVSVTYVDPNGAKEVTTTLTAFIESYENFAIQTGVANNTSQVLHF